MNVAIVTFVFDNFGTKLQAYALALAIKSLGHSVEVINLEMIWEGNKKKKHLDEITRIIKEHGIFSIGPIIKKIWWQISLIRESRKDHSSLQKSRDILFDKFSKSIPYTRYYTCEEVRNGAIDNYDAYIVGSDQVWNYELTNSLDIYFLDFIKNKKRLSYAASFGLSKINPEWQEPYRNYINRMDSLLIREKEGCDICASFGRNDAHVVLDPTLLLNASDYDEIIVKDKSLDVHDITSNERVVLESGKYILVYSLNSSTKIYTESAKLAKKRNLPLVVIKRSFCPPKVKEALATLFCIGPSEFIWLIKNAALVVTNSFHALVFSINLNTPFIPYLKKSDNVNSRLESILNIVGLDDHIVYESDGAISWPLSFDWTNSNLRLEQERKSSMSLLKNTLKTNS